MLSIIVIYNGNRHPCSSSANPTMWKAVEIILGIALVTPEHITDQFAEAVLTRTPGNKYTAGCIKVL